MLRKYKLIVIIVVQAKKQKNNKDNYQKQKELLIFCMRLVLHFLKKNQLKRIFRILNLNLKNLNNKMDFKLAIKMFNIQQLSNNYF